MALRPAPQSRHPNGLAADRPGFARAVLNQISDLVIVIDASGSIIYASGAAERMLGMAPADWLGRSAFELIHPDDLGQAAESMVTSADSGRGVKEPLELRVRHVSGEWRTVELIGNNLLEHPDIGGMVISVRDLSARPLADASARRGRRRFELVFERAPIGMAICELNGRFSRVNAMLCDILRWTPAELLNRSLLDVTAPDQRLATRQRLVDVVAGELFLPSTEQRFLRSDASMVWVRSTVSVLHEDDGAPMHLVVQLEDIETRRRMTEQLEAAATTDSLTGAMNRAGLSALLEQHLSSPRLGAIGVLFVDLDHFKAVNDTYGHAAGDDVLVAVADRIRGAIRDKDVCARTGGDEFVVVCRGLDRPRRAAEVAERVRAALAEPFELSGIRANISGSIGVAISQPGSDPASLLARADAAAYRAKQAGKNRVEVAV